MVKSIEKINARKMRAENGESIKVIAKALNVSVSSVSMWCSDIELNEKQIKELEIRAKDPYYGRRMDYIKKIKKAKEDKIKNLFEKGKSEIGLLSKRELFLIGIGLYWSEGFKKDKQVGFANSDPDMINFFLKWLYECFGYNESNISLRVTVNIDHKSRIREIEEYWSEKTGISLLNFGKPFYQNVKWKKVYENPNNYFGLLRIRVRKSTDFLRIIKGYIEGLRIEAR